MSRKFIKILLCLISIFTAVAAVVYFINSHKKSVSGCTEAEDAQPEEEHLDAGDALDLSSLKFSRHYVDLR